jgi:hypothetical protein
MLPPIRSAAAAICSPFILSVPRTSMVCSMLEMPASPGVSERVPIRTRSEAATTGAAAFSRTMTVRPLGMRWRVTPAACAEAVAGAGKASTAARASARSLMGLSSARRPGVHRP